MKNKQSERMREFFRPEKLSHAQTVLYEIDMLRFARERLLRCAGRSGDEWVFLEDFLLHFRNLIEFFGKPPSRNSDLSILKVTLASLTLPGDKGSTETPYIRSQDAPRIVAASKEPYRTIFTLAWSAGLRAGELLGLTIGDLDFERKLIFPRKQADDRTRSLRDLKTRSSTAPVAMIPEVESVLRAYIAVAKPTGLLFPNRRGRPRKRAYVVKFGLKPVLKKLGLSTKGIGLHAFRHGLGTALSNSKVSPKVVQQILRHADIKTTFRYYVHADTDVQRKALESVALPSIGTNVPIGTVAAD